MAPIYRLPAHRTSRSVAELRLLSLNESMLTRPSPRPDLALDRLKLARLAQTRARQAAPAWWTQWFRLQAPLQPDCRRKRQQMVRESQELV